ncbi:MAG: class I SAM-dependent methyltransferase [Alphaproteobacteria bacterium]|nr:class I SAM-dependent methyltransferase [Alphaproteobacteria bacterium]
MVGSGLPDEAGARLAWVISAPTQTEMKRRYDLWAGAYDRDLGDVDDYLAPIATAKAAKAHLASDARILDAGAGTGLSGQALRDAGFSDLTGLDFAEEMLAVAAGKGIYRETIAADLSRRTSLHDDGFDAVVTVGTTSQVPSEGLREYIRVVRPGGKIIVANWVKAWVERGYAAIQAEFERGGRIALIEKGEPFQALPTTEPEIVYEIWVFEVLG